TVQEWNRYRNECIVKISSQPTTSGLFCKSMFDMYACWTDGVPNTTVKVPCPWYLPWYDQVRNGFVSRECGPDGQWLTVNDSSTWRDHSQCNADDSKQIEQENQMTILAYFRVMYTVGYSLSLASLSLALVILLIFRKLRCTRNYIHTNLFASFILRAVSILTRDALLMKDAPEFRDNKDVSIVLSDQVMSGCRVAQVLMQYCVGANYSWLLVEGLYLHNLLVLMVFSENSYFCVYLFIGWGTPVLFVVPWIVVRYLYENTRCWEINENMAYWWIIRTPILLAILVNFFIFIRIIQILISKLRAHQMRYTDYKFRLAKSTLTLIPLLGIHEVVFAVMTEEQTEGVLRNVNLFFELFFNSFQVQLRELRETDHVTTWPSSSLLYLLFYCPLDIDSQLSSDPTPTATLPAIQHHYHHRAKKGKAYCYISARKQVLNGLDVSALPQCAGEGAVMFSESYC
uniref:Gastric inhibitory polypeptide receptor n=1 Tax=Cyprinus carpio TaxID=7962 RepID=A0A8C1VDW0_CYPCA